MKICTRSLCAVKKHRSCEEILTIAEASDEKKTEGLRLLDAHAQRIALIENAVVERKAAKKLLDTNVQEILNEIHQVTEKVMDLVKHEERVLVESVQAMQNREAQTLDDDISGLETTAERVRKVHDNLSQGLKQSEIDLIYSVIKEKQQNNDGANVENIVKKRFREVDFKFMVSPHVTSFLRHFKSLGQVMLSDETGNSRIPRSGMSTPVSEISEFSTPARIADEFTDHSPPNGTDDGHLTAREKWQRDRQRQMQSQIRDHNQNENVFRFDQPNPVAPSRDRRNLPMRALPRPETPEVYSRPRMPAGRQDFVPRPTSTPPTEVNSFSPSPKSRDVDRFNTIAPYRAMRKDFTPTPDRRSPGPIKSPVASTNGRVEPAQQGENVFSFNQGAGKPDHNFPPGHPHSPHSRWGPSSSSPSGPVYSIVSVKDADTNFGRSFAAVQINEVQKPPRSFPTGEQERTFIIQGHPSHSGGSETEGKYREGMKLDETGRFTPSHVTSDEEKVKRWVHSVAFNSSGIGSKRLISGLGLLSDGRVIIVDQEHYTIQLFDRNFRFVTEMKLDSRPFDVIVLSDTKIAVSLQSERVLKFILITPEGITSFADLGVPCETVCYGVAAGGGNFVVCCGDEVWVLSEEGRAVHCLKKDNSGHGIFIQAEYVAMDATGNTLYISDVGNGRVLAIQLDGRRLWEFSYQGFKPAGLKCCDHYIYVCDRDQHRVLMLNAMGHVVKQSVVGRLENPSALCFSTSGKEMLVAQMRYDAVVSPPKPVHMFVMQ
ncbi:uncharacterized protein LOC127882268 isoform X2 [Dreissena polymorpha]|uniref:uncharacterized protein LOC127882268 isoform X2 n=1 Tax=Dreissena polymorpha TaxID=45954 RepID=UPI002263CBC4|nr:uncharacterized protein LOC127882268 isoform X2 [Dreissena polymorpha]